MFIFEKVACTTKDGILVGFVFAMGLHPMGLLLKMKANSALAV
jgi:hypothetical protein